MVFPSAGRFKYHPGLTSVEVDPSGTVRIDHPPGVPLRVLEAPEVEAPFRIACRCAGLATRSPHAIQETPHVFGLQLRDHAGLVP
ncbi:hypothetical protein N8596_00830, partial [bacterium]|nr:hypothetical protein [bacterium]